MLSLSSPTYTCPFTTAGEEYSNADPIGCVHNVPCAVTGVAYAAAPPLVPVWLSAPQNMDHSPLCGSLLPGTVDCVQDPGCESILVFSACLSLAIVTRPMLVMHATMTNEAKNIYSIRFMFILLCSLSSILKIKSSKDRIIDEILLMTR